MWQKRFVFLIFTSLPVALSGSEENELNFDEAIKIAKKGCAVTANPYQPYVLNGFRALRNEFPFMVALGYDSGGDGKQYTFECGGSILSDSYVLTAAHCIETPDKPKPSIIRAGVDEVRDGERRDDADFDIAETITHPNYSRRFKYHDIALLKLRKPLLFSDVLKNICLETSIEDPDPSTPLVIAGWGTTNASRKAPSENLLRADLSVVNINICGESYQNWRKLPQGIIPEQLCAGDPSGLSDACQGDSGGPLLISEQGSFKLVGVTSFGRGCGSIIPGVYTRVARYLPWIVGHVWPN